MYKIESTNKRYVFQWFNFVTKMNINLFYQKCCCLAALCCAEEKRNESNPLLRHNKRLSTIRCATDKMIMISEVNGNCKWKVHTATEWYEIFLIVSMFFYSENSLLNCHSLWRFTFARSCVWEWVCDTLLCILCSLAFS